MENLHLLRGIERILIVFGGIVSIVLGAWLFKLADIRQDSSGSLKSKLFSMTFTKVGPGVFFAAFGAWILITAMNTHATSFREDFSSAEQPKLQSQTGQETAGQNNQPPAVPKVIRYGDSSPALNGRVLGGDNSQVRKLPPCSVLFGSNC
jgi:hypothetical protein